ncbi:hypothetical protein [Paenibacillus arenilitoris]|uniref:Uncharacterized protein n=1 Tax=Paenibacillus arenilitoris TaxID=2772299 RepID=A0A927CM11_9BACL|nr:hypothetical protein [Paenibacillus arenilitoris]MBD2869287.1 hypothetical protein [Paenibacillus arenilitoris]
MKKVFLIHILFIFAINMIGCSEKYDYTIKPTEYGGTSLGLWHENSDRYQQIHTIKKEGIYYPKITLINHLSTKQKYRLFFFLDYKQINVKKNGEDLSYIDIILNQNEKEVFNINIPELNEGLHDFLVISIRSPEYHLDNDKMIPEDQFFMYRRAALLVGDSSIVPKVSYTKIKTKPTDLQYIQPLLTNAMPLIDFKQIISILESKTRDININININMMNESNEVSIIVLNSNGQLFKDDPLFYTMPSGQATIPIELNDEHLIKDSNLYVISVNNPYKLTTIENSVHSSNLITIK